MNTGHSSTSAEPETIYRGPLPRWLLALAAIAIVSGVVLRFANLDRKIFWFDEIFTSMWVSGHDEQIDINPAIYTGKPLSPADLTTFLQPKPGSNATIIARLLALHDPKWPPLYFLLARLWMNSVGSDPAAMRSLVAVCGLLTIPAFGWLLSTLYQDRRVMLAGMALLALSPLFIRYSQESRPYMLSMLLLLLTHTVFLRALRNSTVRGWALYGALVAVSLYTHEELALAFAVHALYIAACKRYRVRRVLIPYILANVGAAVAFSPWIVVMLRNSRIVIATTEHLGNSLTTGTMFTLLARNISHLLVSWEVQQDRWFLWLVFPVIGLVAYACRCLLRDAPRETSLFVIVQLLLPLVTLALPDLPFGGRIAVMDRYFLAAYLAALLAICTLVSRSQIWRTITAGILAISFVSSISVVQSVTWWEWPQVDLDIASIMNSAPPSLMISQVSFGVIAPLVNKLAPDDRFILTKGNTLPSLPDGFAHIYVYAPSAELLQALSAQPGVTLTKIYEEPRWEESIYTLYELHRNR